MSSVFLFSTDGVTINCSQGRPSGTQLVDSISIKQASSSLRVTTLIVSPQRPRHKQTDVLEKEREREIKGRFSKKEERENVNKRTSNNPWVRGLLLLQSIEKELLFFFFFLTFLLLLLITIPMGNNHVRI